MWECLFYNFINCWSIKDIGERFIKCFEIKKVKYKDKINEGI